MTVGHTSRPSGGGRSGVRLADVVRAMTLATDLGLGQPLEHVSRACLLAVGLAERMDLETRLRSDLFYITQLGWVGCIADSRDVAQRFGDDLSYRSGVYDVDLHPLPFLGYLLRRAGTEGATAGSWSTRAMVMATGGRAVMDGLRGHCQVTGSIARRLGLGPNVAGPLQYIFARWDGRGLPSGVGGSEVPLPIQLWQLSDVAEVHHRRGGPAATVAVIRGRSGTQFDPALVDVFTAHAEDLFDEIADDPDLDRIIVADPELRAPLGRTELDEALLVLADYADLKSPYFAGHSRGVAELAVGAARRLGLARDEVQLIRRAGLVHDLGRTGVPNTIWDKGGPLTTSESERVRLHPYYTERILTRPAELQRIGAVASTVHERLDGSGYHRGLTGASLTMSSRVLAAANHFHALQEPRPHRTALPTATAAGLMLDEAAAGRLDPDAVDAVLGTTGHGPPQRPHGPAGLTQRETEVLVLLAHGDSNRQIARQLGIATKTAGNHIEHVYAKAGVSTRAAATLFAMEHGLLGP